MPLRHGKHARVAKDIPTFTPAGNLPPGKHPAGLEAFRSRFATNAARKKHMRQLESILPKLLELGVCELEIGGSFATSKGNPGDVHMTYLFAPDKRASMQLHDDILAIGRKKGLQLMYPNPAAFSLLRKDRRENEVGTIRLLLSPLTDSSARRVLQLSE
jgi:hypothetical protein